MIIPITGLPGVGNITTAVPREILAGNIALAQFIPGLHVLDGNLSRDPLNAPDIDVLRAGMMVGRVTATGNYASSVLGVLTSAAGSGATTLNVAPAVAAELVRRIGASGTFALTGPPTSGGTVATQSVTYSAVNLSTGAITCSAISAAIAGSFVQPTDGSSDVVTLLANRWGVKVTDQLGNSVDVLEEQLLLEGYVKTANIINYPTDTSLAAFVKLMLRTNCPAMTFDDAF